MCVVIRSACLVISRKLVGESIKLAAQNPPLRQPAEMHRKWAKDPEGAAYVYVPMYVCVYLSADYIADSLHHGLHTNGLLQLLR